MFRDEPATGTQKEGMAEATMPAGGAVEWRSPQIEGP